MKYDNSKIRRQDRLLNEDQAADLLKNGEYGILSMIAEDNTAYGIPISYAWDGNNFIYLHCAPEGQKLNSIKHCAEVSFCIVGKTQVISNKFTTGYESLIIKCYASANIQAEERMHALELILDKYSPNDKETGLIYAQKSFNRTAIIRLSIVKVSGKSKTVG